MYVSHEWERNNWLSVFGIALKQMVSHSTSFLKIFWDIHGDGGRGTVKVEAVSNYDLFNDEGAMIRDGKLVQDKPNTLGFNPYVALSMSPNLERIYSPPVVYHCISPQMEL